MIRVKNHHMAAIIRVDIDLGVRSLPCCISEPTVNHNELQRENSLTRTSCSLHGWGLSHSYGLNLRQYRMENVILVF